METESRNTFKSIFPRYSKIIAEDEQRHNDSIELYIRNQLPHQVEVIKKMQSTFNSFLNQYSNLIVKRPQLANLSYSLASKATELLDKHLKQIELKYQKLDKFAISQLFQNLNPKKARQLFREELANAQSLVREKYIQNYNLSRESEQEIAHTLYTLFQLYFIAKSDLVSLSSKHLVSASKVAGSAFRNETVELQELASIIFLQGGFMEQINNTVSKRCRPFVNKKDFFSQKIKQFLKQTQSKVETNLIIFLDSLMSKQKHRITKALIPKVQAILKSIDDCQQQKQCQTISQAVERLKRKFMEIKNNSYYLDIIRGSFSEKYKMQLNKIQNLYYLNNLEKYLQTVFDFMDQLLRVEENIIENRKNFKKFISYKVQNSIYQITNEQQGKYKQSQQLPNIIIQEFEKLKNFCYAVQDKKDISAYKDNSSSNYYANKVKQEQARQEQMKRERQEKQKIRREEAQKSNQIRKQKQEEERQKRQQIMADAAKKRQQEQQIRKKQREQLQKKHQLERKKKMDLQTQQRKKREQEKKRMQQQRKKRQKQQEQTRKKKVQQQRIERQRKQQQRKLKEEEQRKKQQKIKQQNQAKAELQRKKKSEELKRKQQQEFRKKKQLEQKKMKQLQQIRQKEQQKRQQQQKKRQQQQRKKQQQQAKRKKQQQQQKRKQQQRKKLQEIKKDQELKKKQAQQQQKQRKRKQVQEKQRQQKQRKKRQAQQQEKQKNRKQAQLQQKQLKRKQQQKKKKQQQQLRKKKQEQQKRKQQQQKKKQQQQKRKQQQQKRKQQQIKRQQQNKRQQELKKKQMEEKKKKQQQQIKLKQQQQKKRKQQQQNKKKQQTERKEKLQAEEKKKRDESVKGKKNEPTKKSAINYADLDDELIDEDEEIKAPSKPAPVKGKGKQQQDQYVQDYQDDFDDFSPDKEQKEEDGEGEHNQEMQIQPKRLIDEQNLKCLNQYLKGSSFSRKNKPNLENYNNQTQYVYIFEELIQNRKVFIQETSVSKAIYDFSKQLQDQSINQQDLQLTLETIKEEIALSAEKQYGSPEIDPRTKLIFPFSFANDLNVYLIELTLSEGQVVVVFANQLKDDEASQQKYSNLVQAFLHVYGFEQPAVRNVVVTEQSKAVLDTFDKELPNLLLLFAMHYQQSIQGSNKAKINQYTIDRFFYISHVLEPFYKAIEEESQKLSEFYEKLYEKFTTDPKINIECIQVQSSNPDYEQLIALSSNKLKEDFLKNKSLTHKLAMVQIIIGSEEEEEQSFQKFTCYYSMSKESTKPTLNYYIVSKDDEEQQNLSRMFELSSSEIDDQFETTVYMDFTRHNGLSQYSDWTMPLWAHIVQKKKMTPLQAFRALVLSMTPYYVTYKQMD